MFTNLKGMIEMEINTKEELLNFLTDLQGQMVNLQEHLDTMKPVDPEEEPEEAKDPEVDPEEIDELDSLLQGE